MPRYRDADRIFPHAEFVGPPLPEGYEPPGLWDEADASLAAFRATLTAEQIERELGLIQGDQTELWTEPPPWPTS